MTPSMPPKQTMMHRAEELRHKQTEAEALLWSHLRAHQLKGVHFKRQVAIGNSIVDFCAVRRKVAIEVDGSPHREQKEMDEERTRFLEGRGFLVLRFWNSEVMDDLENVLSTIREAVKSPHRPCGAPPPNPKVRPDK